MITAELRSAYKWQRRQPGQLMQANGHRYARRGDGDYWRRPVSAAEALSRARRDVESGTRRYLDLPGNGMGAPFQSGSTTLRWVERPAAIGLRFVGFADQLADSIGHFGWFTDEYGDGETIRGAVYQPPSRNGRPLYVVGYREGSGGGRGSNWRDTSTGRADDDNGPAALAFGEMIEGTESDSDYYESNRHHDAGRDAAYLADSIAEKAAEIQREYNEAFQEGSRYAGLGEEAAEIRREALQLLAEMKARRLEGSPAICSALRSQLSQLLERLEKDRKERAKIRDNWSANYSWDPGLRAEMVATFNDGAGESVVAV
jgi:hypothetical protein